MPPKGHSKYKGMFNVGDRFGRWTVVDSDIVIERHAKVLCECECKNRVLVHCHTLKNGTSTQCVICGNSMSLEKNPAWKGYKGIPGKVFSKLEREAKLRNLEYNIDKEDLWAQWYMQDGKCALTGYPLTFYGHSNDIAKASCDRIDNDKGYIRGNIQWVCTEINMMKKDLLQTDFIAFCQAVADHSRTHKKKSFKEAK